MPTKTRAATDAREDIMSPAALSALSSGVISAMGGRRRRSDQDAQGGNGQATEWFWHLFAKCEAKAARIAEQAVHGPHACGDATFIEVYAKTMPALLLKGLETAHTSKH